MRHTVLLAFSALAAACSTAPEQPPAATSSGADPGALHAVHNDRLSELMAQMNSLMFERMQTEPDLDRERRRYAGQIAEAADDLSRTIDAIVATLPALELSPREQSRFLVLADKLRGQTLRLHDQARRNRIDAISRTLDTVPQTCAACHQLFRGKPD